MKLSKAQTEVMNQAKAKIDKARTMDYPEWLRETNHYYQVPSWADEEQKAYIDKKWQDAVREGSLKEYWKKARCGMVVTHCNSRTLYKLEEYGLIEIIEDSKGQSYGLDWVKVLNY